MYMDLLKRKQKQRGNIPNKRKKDTRKPERKGNKVKSNQVKKQKSKKVTRERGKGRKGNRDNKG